MVRRSVKLTHSFVFPLARRERASIHGCARPRMPAFQSLFIGYEIRIIRSESFMILVRITCVCLCAAYSRIHVRRVQGSVQQLAHGKLPFSSLRCTHDHLATAIKMSGSIEEFDDDTDVSQSAMHAWQRADQQSRSLHCPPCQPSEGRRPMPAPVQQACRWMAYNR